jgi:hypothetical protein
VPPKEATSVSPISPVCNVGFITSCSPSPDATPVLAFQRYLALDSHPGVRDHQFARLAPKRKQALASALMR